MKKILLKTKVLTEAGDKKRKYFMLPSEQDLKIRLIKLLAPTHAIYAQRLKDFVVHIVPLEEDPECTAWISFDEGIIGIGEGFLVDPNDFYQLSVLLRHELAHNLLMHQIRMLGIFQQKYGNQLGDKLTKSSSFHNIINIIEDFDISNKKYSAEDKKIVRNLKVNGTTIEALVTEDNRQWESLSLAAMYDALEQEIIDINNRLHDINDVYSDWQILAKPRPGSASGNIMKTTDWLRGQILPIFSYRNTSSYSRVPMSMESFIESVSFGNMVKEFQELVKSVYKAVKDANMSKEEMLAAVKRIAASKPTENVWFPGSNNPVMSLDTPEEKSIASDVLKNMAGMFIPSEVASDEDKEKAPDIIRSDEYIESYNKTVSDYDDPELETKDLYAILRALYNPSEVVAALTAALGGK